MEQSTQTAVDAFIEKVVRAKDGASVVYHVGLLPNDRLHNYAANKIAYALLQASDDGLVYLTQRKLDRNLFEYIATRSARK